MRIRRIRLSIAVCAAGFTPCAGASGPYSYIVNGSTRTVTKVDASTHAVHAQAGNPITLASGQTPITAAVSPDGTKIVVPIWNPSGSGSVRLYNADTLATLRTFNVGNVTDGNTGKFAYTAAWAPNGAKFYVAQNDFILSGGTPYPNKVYEYSPTAGPGYLRAINTGTDNPEYLAISPDNTRLFVTSSRADKLRVLNLVPATPTTLFSLDFVYDPGQIVVSPDNTRWAVTKQSPAELWIYDVATNTRQATVALPLTGTAVAFHPQTQRLLVNAGSDLLRFESDGTPAGALAGVGAGASLAVSPDGAWAHLVRGDRVVVVDLSDFTIETEIVMTNTLLSYGQFFAPAPFLFQPTPTVIAAGTPSQVITPYGATLTANTQLFSNEMQRTTTVNGTLTQLTATLTGADLALPGTLTLRAGTALPDEPLPDGARSNLRTITVAGVTITSTSPLPEATFGRPYSRTLTQSYGYAPFLWTTAAGAPPPGVVWTDSSGGTLGGTPTATGDFAFTARIVDSLPAASQFSEKPFTLRVNPAPQIATACPLPDGGRNNPYNQQLQVNGGTAPFSWTISAGALPAGYALDGPGGTISGVSLALGPAAFTLTVTDANGASVDRPCTLTVSHAAGGPYAVIANSASASLSIVNTANDTVNFPAVGGPAFWPWGAAVAPDGLNAFISDDVMQRVYKFDLATMALGPFVSAGAPVHGVAVHPSGSPVYVARNGGQILVLNAGDLSTAAPPLAAGGTPWGVAVNPAGDRLYATDIANNRLVGYTLPGASKFMDLALPCSSAAGVTVRPDGTRVFVACNGYLLGYDAVSGAGAGSVAVSGGDSLAISPDGAKLYVATTSVVLVYDAASFAAAGSFNPGYSLPSGVAIHPDGSRLYATYKYSDAIAIAQTANLSTFVTRNATTGGIGDTPISFQGFIAPPPRIVSLAPAQRPEGLGNFTLTVNGNYFNPRTVIRWNGQDRPTTFVSDRQVTAVISAADSAAPGVMAVSAWNPPAGGGASIPNGSFTVCALGSPGNGVTAGKFGGNLALAWPAAAGATGYRVLRCAGACLPATLIAQPAAPAFADPVLADAVSYRYLIEAEGPCGIRP